MKKYWAALLLALSAGTALALPPAVELDRLMLHAQAAMEAGSYSDAVDNLTKAQKLGIALPESFALSYATALNGLGKTAEAKSALEKYLNKYGTKGASYKQAMALLVQIESQESGKAGEPAPAAKATGAVSSKAAAKQRVPVRPELPFVVSEDVWQVLEASEAYRNAPLPRPYKFSYQASAQTEYTGSKSSTLTPPAPTSKSGTTETTALGEKCWAQRSTNFISGAGSFTSDNYICGGFMTLGSTDGSNATTIIKSIDELTGSLFPMRIGNQMTLRYQFAFLKDRRFDMTIASTCQVTGEGPAGDLDPALKGKAWKVHCRQNTSSAYNSTVTTTETDDYYLEDLGVRLSLIGQLNFPEKRFILPHPGSQTAIIAEGEYGSRTTTTYTLYDWSVGAASPAAGSPAMNNRGQTTVSNNQRN